MKLFHFRGLSGVCKNFVEGSGMFDKTTQIKELSSQVPPDIQYNRIKRFHRAKRAIKCRITWIEVDLGNSV